VEQELLNFPEHLSSAAVFCMVRVAQSLVFTWVNSGSPEGKAVSAPLAIPVALLLVKIQREIMNEERIGFSTQVLIDYS
jgi:hypothetical protein